MKSPFHADVRSLACFRVCLGLIVVGETIWLIPRAHDLLSDGGILPRSTLLSSISPHTQFWSLHQCSGGALVQQLLLLAQLVAGCCLTVGHRSRTAALCCWALVNSVINRNPLMAHGGDTLLRMELLLAAFAPIGARWSLDASAFPPTERSEPVRDDVDESGDDEASPPLARGPGVTALLLQPVTMYFFAGALKFFPEWRDPAHWSAVYYALHIDMCAKPAARLLRQSPALMTMATAVTVPLEQWVGPALLLCPLGGRWQPRARLLALGLLTGLQASFFATMVLGVFPFISTTAVMPFVPAEAWRLLLPRLRPGARAAGSCVGACAAAAARAASSLLGEHPDSAPRRALRVARRALTGAHDGRSSSSTCFPGARACRVGCEHTRAAPFMEEAARAAAAADAAARARAAWDGRHLSRATTTLLLAIGAWVAAWSTQSYCAMVGRFEQQLGGAAVCALPIGVPRQLLWFGELLSLHQSWDLFAPAPNREDGWWAVAGQLSGDGGGDGGDGDGALIDLVRGGALSNVRPEPPAEWYDGSHWFQYYLRLWEEARKPRASQNTALFSSAVQWHCVRAGAGLARAALIFTREPTPPPGEPPSPPERVQVWQEECFAHLRATFAMRQRQQQQQARQPPPRPGQADEHDEGVENE